MQTLITHRFLGNSYVCYRIFKENNALSRIVGSVQIITQNKTRSSSPGQLAPVWVLGQGSDLDHQSIAEDTWEHPCSWGFICLFWNVSLHVQPWKNEFEETQGDKAPETKSCLWSVCKRLPLCPACFSGQSESKKNRRRAHEWDRGNSPTGNGWMTQILPSVSGFNNGMKQIAIYKIIAPSSFSNSGRALNSKVWFSSTVTM